MAADGRDLNPDMRLDGPVHGNEIDRLEKVRTMMTEKENINDILEDVRKKIKPATGPLTSIDPKKMEKVSEDLEIAKEIGKDIQKPGKKEEK